jgi:hypothetical protein
VRRAVRAWLATLSASLELRAEVLREQARNYQETQWFLGYGEGVDDGARRERERQEGTLW